MKLVLNYLIWIFYNKCILLFGPNSKLVSLTLQGGGGGLIVRDNVPKIHNIEFKYVST